MEGEAMDAKARIKELMEERGWSEYRLELARICGLSIQKRKRQV